MTEQVVRRRCSKHTSGQADENGEAGVTRGRNALHRHARGGARTVRVVNVLALCQILCTSMSTPKSQTDSPFRRLVRSLSRSSPRSERPPRPQGPDSPPAVPTPNKRYDDIARYAPGAGSPRRESPPSSAALSTSPPPGGPSSPLPNLRGGGGTETSLAIKEVPARSRTACFGTSSTKDTYLPPATRTAPSSERNTDGSNSREPHGFASVCTGRRLTRR